MNVEINWWPQPRQLKFLDACGLAHPFTGGEAKPPNAEFLLYGGAAGGGKTDTLIIIGIIAPLTYPGCKVGYFRREFPQLEGPGGAIMRSHELISKNWAKWNGTQRRWTFPGGGIFQFCHCKNEIDVFNYQSQQFDILLFDEQTQFLRSIVRYLLTRNRATVNGVVPFAAGATNPGNVGHTWNKKEFVEIGEPEVPHNVEVEPGKIEKHIFIPSKLSDNQILMKRDPAYKSRLENQPDDVRRMLLEGDWDVFAGQVFSEWRNDPDHYLDRIGTHVIGPFKIPKEWRRFRSFDFGYAKPFSVGWWAMDFDGRLYRYRELYGCTGEPNVGIKWYPKQIAARIREIERELEEGNNIVGYADNAIWDGSEGESVAEQMEKEGVYWEKVDKARIAGKMQVHYRLAFDEEKKPMLYVFKTCKDFIRTMPALIYDRHKPEDVDTNQEDHIYDETRFICYMNPIAPRKNIPLKLKPYDPLSIEPAYNPYGFMSL